MVGKSQNTKFAKKLSLTPPKGKIQGFFVKKRKKTAVFFYLFNFVVHFSYGKKNQSNYFFVYT